MASSRQDGGTANATWTEAAKRARRRDALANIVCKLGVTVRMGV